MFIFKVIGVLILLTLVIAFVQKRVGFSLLPASVMKTFTSLVGGLTSLFVGLFLTFLGQILFYAEYGYNYYLVSPFGKEYVIMDSRGIQLRLFARVTPWPKYIDIKTVELDETGKISEDTSELEGFISGGVPIRFIDQVTGDAKFATRFQLPSTEEEFLNLAKKFRTCSNLVNNTLIPTLIEQTKNTGYMFSAQNYISGEAQQFKQTLEEQLKGGSYQVKKEEIKDTIYNDITDKNSRSIREITTTYKVSKITDRNGVPVRIPHEITDNGVLVNQVIIQDVDLEPKFKERLENQRDESAKRQLAQQETETAKAEQLKILAQGENAKAQERIAKEKEQITQVIQYETEKEIEKQKLEKAKIAFETAEIEAKATRVKADAEAYKNQKLVSAGLTPQERAQIDKEISIGVAQALANLKLPTYYITGNGSSSNNNMLESLLGVKLLELNK